MSTLPSIEAILLEVHQCLGCPSIQSKKKQKFSTGQKCISEHTEMGIQLLSDIFEALGMGPDNPDTTEHVYENVMDINSFMTEFANAYKCLELNSWTYAADDRHILWMLLSHLYTPAFARYVGLRSVEQTLDKGMPGGRFWYLPEPRMIDGALETYLPVVQVFDWLLDLLGMSVEKVADQHSDSNNGAHDGLRRSLYNWRDGTTIKARKIEEYFADDTVLDFKGVFTLDTNRTPEEQFNDALDFVKRKKFTADTLCLEIPITGVERLEQILEGCVDEQEQAIFVHYLVDRFSTPSMHTIRQRLLIGRAMQDGYVRLLKFLFPNVDPKCADSEQNKLLQLFAMYKCIYNFTFKAAAESKGRGARAEEKCFDSLIPDLYKQGVFLSVTPSLVEVAMPLLGRLLTRKFYRLQKDTALEHCFGVDEGTEMMVIKMMAEHVVEFHDEQERSKNLLKRMNNSPHGKVLQDEQSFWVISQLAVNRALKPRAKKVAIERAYQLAKAPFETVKVILLELDGYLNGDRKLQQKDAHAKVEALLSEATASEGYELWKAPILQYKAKHLLACNEFEEAVKLFRQALDACLERNFGTLNGEIGRNCFAVSVANQKLIHENHEKYFRAMLAGGMFEDSARTPPTIEESARRASNYFCDDLYRTYPEFPVQKRRMIKPIEDIFEQLMPLLISGDENSLNSFIKTHRALLSSKLPDVDGNSVLILLIKIFNGFRDSHKKMGWLKSMMPRKHQEGLDQLEKITSNGLLFVKLMASEHSSQVNLVDLKKQSPLMLMAEKGDTASVNVLLAAGANPDLQDWLGLTALHAAIKSRVDSCVDALLDHPRSTNLSTQGGRTVLHTATLFGNLHSVERLIELAPELAWQQHDDGGTPLEDIDNLFENPERQRQFYNALKNSPFRGSSKEELEIVAKLLEQVPPPQKD